MYQKIFTEFDEILFNDKRPWLDSNLNSEFFIKKIDRIEHIELPFSLTLKSSYEQPFNNKTKYYYHLILHFKNHFLYELFTIFESHEVPVPKLEKYLKEVEQELNSRIRHTSKIINAIQFGSGMFDLNNLSFWADPVMASNAYIINYLRLSLFQISYEIKTRFSDLLNGLLFSQGLIIGRIHENLRSQAYQPVGIANTSLAVCENSLNEDNAIYNIESVEFVAISDNIRKRIEGIPLFRDLVRNPVRFGKLEEQLYQRGFINLNCTFCGKRGSKNILAVIYHFLIEKNYFKGFNDTLKRKNRQRDIVKFLNHRYEINLSKQFDIYKNNPDERSRIVESLYWLRQLPSC